MYYSPSIVYAHRNGILPKYISFKAFSDGGIEHRGFITSADDLNYIRNELEKEYDVVLFNCIKINAVHIEEIRIYDAKTNERLV